MKRAPSIGTPSIYSHTSVRSVRSVGLRSTRSAKSLYVPWYKRPLLQSVLGPDVQRLSLTTAIYSVVSGIFTFDTKPTWKMQFFRRLIDPVLLLLDGINVGCVFFGFPVCKLVHTWDGTV